jgi:hypothetical protein
LERFLLAVVTFVFSAHYFPIMAWHTIDALLLISFGVILCVRSQHPVSAAGILLISASCLCKQNFVVVAPAVILLLGQARSLRCWLLAMIPGAVYLTWLAGAGALPDAVVQLTSQTDILSTGIWRYLGSGSFEAAVLLGYFGSRLLFGPGHRSLGLVMLLMVPTFSAVALAQGHFTAHPAVGLFGVVLGITIYFSVVRSQEKYQTAGWLVLVVAWSASISIGYNTPALVAGPLAAFIIAMTTLPHSGPKLARHARVASLGIVVIATVAFVSIRYHHVYRDAAPAELTYRLDGVLPGANGIRTNGRTWAYFHDLHRLTHSLGHNEYCVLPDTACWWVKSDAVNPLPLDWPIDIELNNPRVLRRVLRTLDSRAASMTIIVERFDAASLATGRLSPAENRVAAYVRSHFIKRSHTHWFDVYKGLKAASAHD